MFATRWLTSCRIRPSVLGVDRSKEDEMHTYRILCKFKSEKSLTEKGWIRAIRKALEAIGCGLVTLDVLDVSHMRESEQ
jgi:hypothetical protein